MQSLNVQLLGLGTIALAILTGCAGSGPTSGTTASAHGGGVRHAHGQPISEADLARWNIDVITKTGAGLPSGAGTVSQGKDVYAAKCAVCHGDNAAGGPMFGSMVGGIGSFKTNTRVLTPGSMYPYAPILFDYVRRAMPLTQPQSLTNDEVYAVSGYILHLNGLLPATATVNAQTLASLRMPNRDGFIVDDRPDTKAQRCMSNCRPL